MKTQVLLPIHLAPNYKNPSNFVAKSDQRPKMKNAKNCCQMGWICCAFLQVVSSKSHCENLISFIFLESPHQVDMKNFVKSSKPFQFFLLNYKNGNKDFWVPLQNDFALFEDFSQ